MERNRQILNDIILANIETNPNNPPRVYTDLWMEYSHLEQLGYEHRKLNHSVTWGYGSKHTKWN